MIQHLQNFDFVHVYSAIPTRLCQEIITLFDQDQSKWQGRTVTKQGKVGVEEETKKSFDLEILPEGDWKEIFEKIHVPIQECMQHYISLSPALQSVNLEATGYKIQMYPKGEGYFRWHADAIGKGALERVFAMIIYLNDVTEGGETEFYHQKIKIRPQQGQLVLFPTAWNYMHCGNMPVSGDKYIITSFAKIVFQEK